MRQKHLTGLSSSRGCPRLPGNSGHCPFPGGIGAAAPKALPTSPYTTRPETAPERNYLWLEEAADVPKQAPRWAGAARPARAPAPRKSPVDASSVDLQQLFVYSECSPGFCFLCCDIFSGGERVSLLH